MIQANLWETYHPIRQTPDENLFLIPLLPTKCIRPNFLPNSLPFLLGLPPALGLRRFDRRKAFGRVEARSISGDQLGRMDDMVLSD